MQRLPDALGLGLLAKAGVTVGVALLVEQDPRMAGVAAIFVNGSWPRPLSIS